MAVCGLQTVYLAKDAIKILDIYFSYNINLMNQENYCKAITSIHGILKLWRMRSLSIEGKIVVFKTLAIFKLVYLALVTVIPNNVLYLNEKLFQFGKTQSHLCSFCHNEAETTTHVFHKCSVTKTLWNQLSLFFETDLDFPHSTRQAALFGFIN